MLGKCDACDVEVMEVLEVDDVTLMLACDVIIRFACDVIACDVIGIGRGREATGIGASEGDI